MKRTTMAQHWRAQETRLACGLPAQDLPANLIEACALDLIAAGLKAPQLRASAEYRKGNLAAAHIRAAEILEKEAQK